MLHYMGPNIGAQGPMAAQLPPATPGTIPQAVPGVQPAPLPVPPMRGMGIQSGRPPMPHHIAQSILRTPIGAPGPPPPPEYATSTQPDGSILLHLKNPDGSKGLVVKVLPPIKQPEKKEK